MERAHGLFDIDVSGDYACFTRAEFKAERVSYPIITPSAARGLLEAVLWKPAMRWEIREIRVLNPLQQTTVMRNELGERQTRNPVFIEALRQQRTSLILKDVKYRITAQIVLRPHTTDPLAKYTEQFTRRLERGQHYHMPYLGTREFAARVEAATEEIAPQPLDLGIGQMLFDIAYRMGTGRGELSFYRHDAEGKHLVNGQARALFFNGDVRQGVLTVPPEKYRELYALEDGNA